jgi:hypothetical protein
MNLSLLIAARWARFVSRHRKGYVMSDGSKIHGGDMQARMSVADAEGGALHSVSKHLPGPRYIAAYLLALPVIVVAIASSGVEQTVSWAIALTWLVMAPTALYARGAAILLPILSALFVGLAVTTLSFDSTAFVVDVTATAIMFLVSMPRHWPGTVASTPSTVRG